MSAPKGGTAVMARRAEPWDSLDCFPTPPWATRALFVHVLPKIGVTVPIGAALDPAAGLFHMVDAMRPFCSKATGSDVFDYRNNFPAPDHNFLEAEAIESPVDWIITNPPFNQAEAFVRQAGRFAQVGIAMLCRLQLLEGAGRYHNLFRLMRPAVVAAFAERVPMVRGRWDPKASSATAYAWFVWTREDHRYRRTGEEKPWPKWDDREPFPALIIPPGCREGLTEPADKHLARRVAPGCEIPAPLLEAGS